MRRSLVRGDEIQTTPAATGSQFTIRDILLLTMAVGALLALGRYALVNFTVSSSTPENDGFGALIGEAIGNILKWAIYIGGGIGLIVSQITTWVALSRRPLAVSALILALVFGVPVAFLKPDEYIGFALVIGTFYLGIVAAILPSILILRACGYRLQRIA